MGDAGRGAHKRAPHFQTTLDRLGLALGAGGLLHGGIAALLAARAGQTAGAIVMIAVVGSLLAMAAIVATFGPLWLALHASGRRGPMAAGLLGAGLALALWLAAAHGLLASFAFADRGTAAVGWLRVAGVALMITASGVAAALLMWRIAYRRVG